MAMLQTMTTSVLLSCGVTTRHTQVNRTSHTWILRPNDGGSRSILFCSLMIMFKAHNWCTRNFRRTDHLLLRRRITFRCFRITMSAILTYKLCLSLTCLHFHKLLILHFKDPINSFHLKMFHNRPNKFLECKRKATVNCQTSSSTKQYARRFTKMLEQDCLREN